MKKGTLMLIIGAVIAFFGYRWYTKNKINTTAVTLAKTDGSTGSVSTTPGDSNTSPGISVPAVVIAKYFGPNKDVLMNGDHIEGYINQSTGYFVITKIYANDTYISGSIMVDSHYVQ